MTVSEMVRKWNAMAWGPWMLMLLLGTGIYLSVRLGFIQFAEFRYVMKNTAGKLFCRQKAGGGEVTPVQAMTTALAATVGIGNIAGVAGAISLGGPGTVFWMWISALFGMATKYAEVVLAVYYRERNEQGDYVGGPMYYIRNGLGRQWNALAVVFCLLASLAAFGIGNMTQVNTIVGTVHTVMETFGADAGSMNVFLFDRPVPAVGLAIGFLVAAAVVLVLFGGIKRIGAVTEKLVPVMAAVYMIGTLIVIGNHAELLDDVFSMIFKGAFCTEAALGGAFGIGVMTTVQKGIGRGVFSNEAGLGSAPMAYAATSEKDPVRQGLYGIFEVFADTVVICTLTALTLLCGIHDGVDIAWGQSAGAELIMAAFGTVFGARAGALIVAVGIVLFALATIFSWSLYGGRCAEFLFGPKAVTVYHILFVAAIMAGAVLELELVWNISDTLNGFMAIPNLVALLGLSGVVIRLTREHFEQQKINT